MPPSQLELLQYLTLPYSNPETVHESWTSRKSRRPPRARVHLRLTAYPTNDMLCHHCLQQDDNCVIEEVLTLISDCRFVSIVVLDARHGCAESSYPELHILGHMFRDPIFRSNSPSYMRHLQPMRRATWDLDERRVYTIISYELNTMLQSGNSNFRLTEAISQPYLHISISSGHFRPIPKPLTRRPRPSAPPPAHWALTDLRSWEGRKRLVRNTANMLGNVAQSVGRFSGRLLHFVWQDITQEGYNWRRDPFFYGADPDRRVPFF